jgi:hypothetical protein
METGKCREAWEHTSLLISAMAAFAFSPQKLDPKRLNPYYVEPPKTKEQEQEESRAAFALLGAGLRELC